MPLTLRSKELRKIEVDGVDYAYELVEIPFREGVEIRCDINGRTYSVSDRGLGEHEAVRLLVEEITASKSSG